MYRFFLCHLFLILYVWTASAQVETWKEALQQRMTVEEMEDSYGENVMEMLEDYAEHKINLNQTTREELEQLPFLTAQQVEAIMEYLHRYHPIRTLSELQMITAIDSDTRRLLCYFVEAGDMKPQHVRPTWSDVAKYGKHSLTGTVKLPLYDRRGDHNGYAGYKLRHDLRYQFNFKNQIKFGLTAAQDSGEPFFANCNTWGYDYYSYYLQLRDFGRLEALNLGMFRVQMGMGLIMNTGFHLGKLASLQSLGRSTHTLTAHSSRWQSGYLRGAGATIRLARQWHTTLFASYRPLDATLNSDGTARTIVSDGYHRTPTEIAKKSNTHQTDLGLSTGWRKGTAYVNANMIYTHLDRKLMPDKSAPYRQHYAEGNDFLNMSLDYGYSNPRISIAGETALNREGRLAMLHSLSYRMSHTLTLMMIHRYYDQRYTALHARSFSEGSGVQNEHGVYAGVKWRPASAWLLQGYADYAHFSGPRYQVSAPSDAFDAMVTSRYSGRRWSADARYRLHLRQRNDPTDAMIMNRWEHRLRLGCDYEAMSQLNLRTQADGVIVSWMGQQSRGVMLSQQVQWQWRWLQAQAKVGWFHTDDYDSRIYQYEPSVQYDYSFPAYDGHGLRYAIMIRAQLGHHLQLSAKASVTDYFNRSVISSGWQQINQSSMTDLLLQLRIRL